MSDARGGVPAPVCNGNAPCPHPSCVISSLRGLRNGLLFGLKIRFAHSIAIALITNPSDLLRKEKLIRILKTAFEHARRLGLFVLLYKTGVCVLNKLRGQQSKYHSLVCGAVFGYVAFGEETPITQQINLYLLSRVIYGGIANLNKKKNLYNKPTFHMFAAFVWALVMFLFEDDRQTLNKSLALSMVQLYKDSDQPLNHWTELLPPSVLDFTRQLTGGGGGSAPAGGK